MQIGINKDILQATIHVVPILHQILKHKIRANIIKAWDLDEMDFNWICTVNQAH